MLLDEHALRRLLEACNARTDAAWREFVKYYYPSLRMAMRKYVTNLRFTDSERQSLNEDLCQNVLLSFYQNGFRGLLKLPGNLHKPLMKFIDVSCHNEVNSYIRESLARKRIPDYLKVSLDNLLEEVPQLIAPKSPFASAEYDQLDILCYTELLANVRACIEQHFNSNWKHKLIVLLAVLGDSSSQDIGSLQWLGLTDVNVRKIISRGKAQIRDCLVALYADSLPQERSDQDSEP